MRKIDVFWKKYWIVLVFLGFFNLIWAEVALSYGIFHLMTINSALGSILLIAGTIYSWRQEGTTWKEAFRVEVIMVVLGYVIARIVVLAGPPRITSFLFWHIANFFAASSVAHFCVAVICHWADCNVFRSREYRISKNFAISALIFAVLIFYFSYSLLGGPVSFYHDLALRLRYVRVWIFALPILAYLYTKWSNKRIPPKINWPSSAKNMLL